MKQEEFATVMLDSKTKEEVFSIIKHLSSVSSSPVDFLETKRCGLQFDAEIQRCCRFGSLSLLLWVEIKLRFRDGLVWTVGLTVEIKLRFLRCGVDRAIV